MDADEVEEKPKSPEQPEPEAPIEDRNEFRRARAMHVDVETGGGVAPPPVRHHPDDPAPQKWDALLAEQSLAD